MQHHISKPFCEGKKSIDIYIYLYIERETERERERERENIRVLKERTEVHNIYVQVL